MAENKEYMIHQEDDGSIQISEDVLASIASTTALEVDGVSALMSAIVKAKPAAAKGQYIKSCVVATTMGPGIRLNPNKFGA